MEMTENRRLLNFFMSEHFKYELSDCKHLVSPDFTFIMNSQVIFDYRAFAHRRAYLYHRLSFNFGEFFTYDDESFYMPVELKTLDGSSILGQSMINVSAGKIQYSQADYFLTDEDFIAFYTKLYEDYVPLGRPSSSLS